MSKQGRQFTGLCMCRRIGVMMMCMWRLERNVSKGRSSRPALQRRKECKGGIRKPSEGRQERMVGVNCEWTGCRERKNGGPVQKHGGRKSVSRWGRA